MNLNAFSTIIYKVCNALLCNSFKTVKSLSCITCFPFNLNWTICLKRKKETWSTAFLFSWRPWWLHNSVIWWVCVLFNLCYWQVLLGTCLSQTTNNSNSSSILQSKKLKWTSLTLHSTAIKDKLHMTLLQCFTVSGWSEAQGWRPGPKSGDRHHQQRWPPGSPTCHWCRNWSVRILHVCRVGYTTGPHFSAINNFNSF